MKFIKHQLTFPPETYTRNYRNEASGSRVQGQPLLHRHFKAILGYIRFCLKPKTEQTKALEATINLEQL